MAQTNTPPGRDDPSRSSPSQGPRRDADAARQGPAEASAPGRAAADRSVGHAGETGASSSEETRVGDIAMENVDDPGRSTTHPSATGTEWGMKSRGEESTPARGKPTAGSNEDAASMEDTHPFGMGQGGSGTNPEA